MQKGFHPVDEVFFALCKETDTPVSLSAWLRYKYSHRELLELQFRPGDYLEWDSDRFARDYAVCSFLSKWKGLNTGYDLESIALTKFAASESQCRETNARLRAERHSPSDGSISARIYRAKRKIARLLGPCTLHAIDTHFGWGPGATHDIPRARAQVDTKMTQLPITVGGCARELLSSVIQLDLHWSGAILGVYPEGPFSFMPNVFLRVDTCRVTTVPKTAKTNRVIAIEPTGNLFLQKGVGGFLRSRLKRVGVDLDDQGVNQRLAAQAVVDSLATLDLKAASDSVSKELVYELLPWDWAVLLDHLRSPQALMPDGSVIRLEKFSSMGNGFTFELESLIFWALGMSVFEDMDLRGVLSVYGDDLICSEAVAAELVRTLRFVGFEVNGDKSFTSGLFYESCGKHFFNGRDVTPVYQKEDFSDIREHIRCHNRLVRWSERVGLETRSHLPIIRNVPSELSRCRLPYGVEGDDGFLSDVSECLSVSRSLCANRGLLLRVSKGVLKTFPGHEPSLLALTLRQTAYRQTTTEREPCYGNVTVDGYGRKPVSEATILYGWRWVVPPGYCVLPRR